MGRNEVETHIFLVPKLCLGIHSWTLCVPQRGALQKAFPTRSWERDTGGYVNGQTIVFLLLVSNTITVPVGFAFYMPDPVLSAWKKNDDKLKKQGVCKKDRPVKPIRNPDYPTKIQIALNLLQKFNVHHNEIRVQAVLADALYGESKFMNPASKIFGGVVNNHLLIYF